MKNTFEFYNKYYNKSTFLLMKDQRGITLIALIVTIVVLLIVAGITIVNIRGGDKTIDKAQDAKIQHEKSDITERIQAAVLSSATPEGDFVLEDVKSAITQNVNNATFLNNQFPLNVQVDSNRYYVDAEGQVNDTGYVEKEYLKSTGTQYIDTNYYSTSETRVKIKFSYILKNGNYFSNGMIFGSANQENGIPSLSIGISLNDKVIYRNSNNSKSFNSSFSINNNDIYEVDTYKNDIKINNNLYSSDMGLISNKQKYSSYLFARHHPNGTGGVYGAYSKFIGKIYYCKIYEGDTLIRDYIPAVSLETGHENEPCLYDKVEGKFYYNQGTGTFETD